jgi:Fe2+ transport system protein FeoA
MIKRNVQSLTDLTSGQSGIVIDVDGSGETSSVKQGSRHGWRKRVHNRGSAHIGQEDPLKNCSEKRCGFVQRLMDLGLTPGTKVAVVKLAPFNGPVEILVRGSRIALGRCVASRIKVEVTG